MKLPSVFSLSSISSLTWCSILFYIAMLLPGEPSFINGNMQPAGREPTFVSQLTVFLTPIGRCLDCLAARKEAIKENFGGDGLESYFAKCLADSIKAGIISLASLVIMLIPFRSGCKTLLFAKISCRMTRSCAGCLVLSGGILLIRNMFPKNTFPYHNYSYYHVGSYLWAASFFMTSAVLLIGVLHHHYAAK